MKCPNCYEEIKEGAEYCMACGYRLSVSIRVPKREASGDGAGKMEASCPNGHPVSHPELGFCEICGAPLVFKESGSAGKRGSNGLNTVPINPMPEPKPEPEVEIECPSCRMKFKDGKLKYCPVCGDLLKSAGPGRHPKPRRIEWRCGVCGFTNDDGNGFCVACGKARGAVRDDRRDKTTEDEREEETGSGTGVSSDIPIGMYVPDPGSLTPKHNFGKRQR